MTAARNSWCWRACFRTSTAISPTGTYVRNPPTLAPHARRGTGPALIFVKLWQFDPDDRTAIRTDTAAAEADPVEGRPGVAAIPLFSDAREDVRIETWAPGARIGARRA